MAEQPRTKPPSSEIEALKRRIRVPGSKEWLKICAYGPNGSGKTRLAGSAPKVLVIDINEEGDRSIKGMPGTRVIQVSTWEEIGRCYWYLQSGKHPFESVALDTLTEMQACALSFVLAEAENRDPTREKAMPDRRTWGRAGQLMRAMLVAYRNLPLHVIFTAQQRIVRDEDSGEIEEICPDLPNSSRGIAMGSVGILGRLMPREVRVRQDGKVRKVWRDQMMVGPHEIIQTKDRTGSLPPIISNPTIPDLIAVWNS